MEQNLHFIGIGGIGMSAIANIMLGMGYTISGSDVKAGVLTEALIEQGASIKYGHRAENIPTEAEVVVYSSAVKEDNLEMIEARRRGLIIYRRAEMLAFLMSTRRSIGVAGAHGKTTTSGMIATMLEFAGEDPTIIIGGMLPSIGGSNAKAGSGLHLVAEADESDGTFLLLHPAIAVITNIDSDHLDHYDNLDNIIAAFEQYLRQLPYSLSKEDQADYWAENIAHDQLGRANADIYYQGELLGRLALNLPGKHNIANAVAAIAVGRSVGLPFDRCVSGLSHFTGTGRRFECLGIVDGVKVIDDYAHHPAEVAATIQAARDVTEGRLAAVFQPHRYTRTQSMYKDFAAAVMAADYVVISEIYPAFEAPIPGVSARMIVDEARDRGYENIVYAATEEDALALLLQEMKPSDLLLIMGAGNIRRLGENYVKQKRRIIGE
ncbi:MAG: UDP-N-acetylmuramate--L-alanine ligase [Clostridiales bacterium]